MCTCQSGIKCAFHQGKPTSGNETNAVVRGLEAKASVKRTRKPKGVSNA